MALGGWNRGRVLGRGSTATVSLATAASSGEQFAVKSAELAGSSFLRRERKILSSLSSSSSSCCKNLVSYLGHDITADGQYNIFLEYAPGGSLHDQIVKRGGGELGEATVRSYARGIVAGLAFLHSEKVVHCDVKSRNVLVGSDGQAKIADLGCAKSFDEEELQVRGTPMFMAPEVARGEGQGPAADVWAAGCVVVEMATGRAPWPEASDAMAVLRRIAFSEDVPAAPERMSEQGKDFLSKCLRRDPGGRWSAEQLLKHPFLTTCSDSDMDLELKCCKWTSPKSVLDHSSSSSSSSIWWEEVEDAAEQQRMIIAELAAASASAAAGSGPNWTWDHEDWLPVRTDDGKEYEAAAAEQQTVIMSSGEEDATTSTVAISNAISTASSSSSSSTDLLPSEGSVGCCRDLVGRDDISCYSQTSIVTLLATSSCNIVVHHSSHKQQFSNETKLVIMLATFNLILKFKFALASFQLAINPSTNVATERSSWDRVSSTEWLCNFYSHESGSKSTV